MVKLKTWNFGKNVTVLDWQLAVSLVKKRKELGKDSEVRIRSKSIPVKKQKKELGRYAYLENNLKTNEGKY